MLRETYRLNVCLSVSLGLSLRFSLRLSLRFSFRFSLGLALCLPLNPTFKMMPPGLEPGISGSVDRGLAHWAIGTTFALKMLDMKFDFSGNRKMGIARKT